MSGTSEVREPLQYNVTGYVRDACAATLGERNPTLKDYVACRLDELLAGRVADVIALLEDP